MEHGTVEVVIGRPPAPLHEVYLLDCTALMNWLVEERSIAPHLRWRLRPN